MIGWPAVAATAHAIVAGMLLALPAAAQDDVPACAEHAGYAKLDFRIGEWDVYVGDTLAGHNRIERVLAGCAMIEHWTGAVTWIARR